MTEILKDQIFDLYLQLKHRIDQEEEIEQVAVLKKVFDNLEVPTLVNTIFSPILVLPERRRWLYIFKIRKSGR